MTLEWAREYLEQLRNIQEQGEATRKVKSGLKKFKSELYVLSLVANRGPEFLSRKPDGHTTEDLLILASESSITSNKRVTAPVSSSLPSQKYNYIQLIWHFFSEDTSRNPVGYHSTETAQSRHV